VNFVAELELKSGEDIQVLPYYYQVVQVTHLAKLKITLPQNSKKSQKYLLPQP
jgi:hypothetical protein